MKLTALGATSLETALTIGLITSRLQAHEHRGSNEQLNRTEKSFSEIKAAKLGWIDQMRNCVAKATSFEEMKGCWPERKPSPKP